MESTKNALVWIQINKASFKKEFWLRPTYGSEENHEIYMIIKSNDFIKYPQKIFIKLELANLIIADIEDSSLFV